MLVNFIDILKDAQKGRYAVGHFNTSDLEISEAIIRGAEQQRAPVIIGTSPKALDYAGIEPLFALLKTLADRATVPVAVHLDHGKDLELAKKTIFLGYPSVMLDVSSFSEDQKIPVMREVVALAHQKGVSVEGERDRIGGAEDYVQGQKGLLTDPKVAADFVQETNIDSFAVSIGNRHGKPSADETLDLELLERIRAKVPVPLVLHGASSTPSALLKGAIERGITKINIDTDLRFAFLGALRETLENDAVTDPREALGPAREAAQKVVEQKIELFGSTGKA